MSETDALHEPLAQATGCGEYGGKRGMAAFGGRIEGLRRERVQDSPHFDGQKFNNPVATPMAAPSVGVAWQYFFDKSEREPSESFPILRPDPASLAAGRGGEDLRITWLGHSTVLIEVDGRLILTDPVFGPRASPFAWMGPKRFHPAPIEPEQLPPLDLIIVSHDHYDHLDFPTINKLATRETRWVTSLGVGAHLERWGVPADRITELGWWQEADIGGLQIVATPCRHFSGRGPGTAATFWSSWVIRGPRHSVWFSGDTGPWDEGFAEIGERFGGFDLSLIEIGAWHPSWGSIHLGPEKALRVHQQVRAKTMMPVHWGTFSLALHAWDQPIVHLMDLAEREGVQLLSPMMGESVHREAGVADYWRERR